MSDHAMNEQELYDLYIRAQAQYSSLIPLPDDPSAAAWLPYAEDRTKYALHVVADAARGRKELAFA